MNLDPNELSISFFDALGGDAVWIRYRGNDHLWHNILIDGGYIGSYEEIFKPVLDAISLSGEFVDLWIITHIDLDHIGAVISFIADKTHNENQELIKLFWFNHAEFRMPSLDGKVGYKQGIALRSYLESTGKLLKEKITIETGTVDFYGLELTLLGPTLEKIAAADLDWNKREVKGGAKISRRQSDHHKKIEEFTATEFTENADIVNGSSIIFLLKFKSVRGLFLADGHPSDAVNGLKTLGYTKENPIKVNFVKVSHHGSKNNTSPELLTLIDTAVYVISANGISNKHPDKETMARILHHHQQNGRGLEFKYTSGTDQIRSIFNSDENPEQRFNFIQTFIEEDHPAIILNYPALNNSI
ncbi:ComEC/Rec2 family competence protein [Flavobacterium procerum]|uniref:ComEC/Rec2 family competence protein n=1 Tax=Flavobacterium procerum TaxID=1455569 RepID=A0ABV6BY08_9FLAO